MFLKALEDRVNKPKTKKVRDTSSPNKKPTCVKCGKGHFDECLVGKGNCFSCGKTGHKFKDFPNLKGQDKGSRKAQASGSNVGAPKKNRFYVLQSRVSKRLLPTW